MTLQNVPWAVEGGLHSAASAREMAYNATGGSEGVSGPLDMRVLTGGGMNVVIKDGSATILNRYPNQNGEAYGPRNVGDEVFTVPSTGATGRTDLLVLRIDDPDFGGTVPSDPEVGPYNRFELISNVPAGTTQFYKLGRAYPAIALARLEIPANTTTLTQGMIKDVRRVARPRRERTLLTHALVSGETDQINLYSPVANERWPDRTWPVYVPEWATVARVTVRLDGVRIPPGNAYGKLQVLIGYQDPGGDIRTQEVGYDTAGVNNFQRWTMGIADDIAVPANLRGKDVLCEILGRAESGPTAQQPQLDWGSAVTFDVEFFEKAALT